MRRKEPKIFKEYFNQFNSIAVKFIMSIIFLILINNYLSAQYYIDDFTVDNNNFINAESFLEYKSLMLADTFAYNTEYLPPVGNQGFQGSCTAWSIGYYQLTYKSCEQNSLDPSLISNQFSPAFLYNQANGGFDYGSGGTGVYNLLLYQGCSSLEFMPYDVNDYTSWPSRSAYLEAISYRIKDIYYLPQSYTEQGKNLLRSVLLAGEVVTMSIDVDESMNQLNQTNDTYTIENLVGGGVFRHNIAIVGFDDSKITADGTGAFYCVNSWGTNWGDQGFFWISYQLFMYNQINHGKTYYITLRENYTPSLIVNFNASHSFCSNVDVKVEAGNLTRYWWEHNIIYFSPVENERSYPAYRIPIDITELSDYVNIENAEIKVVFDDTYDDDYFGSVEFVDIESLDDTIYFVASDVPQDIPDYGSAYISDFSFFYTSVSENHLIQNELFQNYPNPFNTTTYIEYYIANPSKINVSIFDITGRKIRFFEFMHSKSGHYKIQWNGKDNFGNSVLPGTYIYQLVSDNFSEIKKLQYLK